MIDGSPFPQHRPPSTRAQAQAPSRFGRPMTGSWQTLWWMPVGAVGLEREPAPQDGSFLFPRRKFALPPCRLADSGGTGSGPVRAAALRSDGWLLQGVHLPANPDRFARPAAHQASGIDKDARRTCRVRFRCSRICCCRAVRTSGDPEGALHRDRLRASDTRGQFPWAAIPWRPSWKPRGGEFPLPEEETGGARADGSAIGS